MSGDCTEYDKRAAIMVALRAGRKPAEIANFLNLPRSLVYRVKKGNGSAERKKHKRRSDSIRTDDFLGRLSEKISENPGKSITGHSVEANCHRSTISRSLTDLGLKSFRYKSGQLLTDAMMESRLLKASNLLSRLKHDGISLR